MVARDVGARDARPAACFGRLSFQQPMLMPMPARNSVISRPSVSNAASTLEILEANCNDLQTWIRSYAEYDKSLRILVSEAKDICSTISIAVNTLREPRDLRPQILEQLAHLETMKANASTTRSRIHLQQAIDGLRSGCCIIESRKVSSEGRLLAMKDALCADMQTLLGKQSSNKREWECLVAAARRLLMRASGTA